MSFTWWQFVRIRWLIKCHQTSSHFLLDSYSLHFIFLTCNAIYTQIANPEFPPYFIPAAAPKIKSNSLGMTHRSIWRYKAIENKVSNHPYDLCRKRNLVFSRHPYGRKHFEQTTLSHETQYKRVTHRSCIPLCFIWWYPLCLSLSLSQETDDA